jgi:HlyD family secretion protein
LDEQIRRQAELQREKAALAADWQSLLTGSEKAAELRTTVSRHELVQFRSQLEANRLAEAKARSEFTRYAVLAERGVATRQELDNARFEVERLTAEARLYREQTAVRWANYLKDEQSALANTISTRRRLEEERTRYTVRAPATGVLMGFGGWKPGTLMLAGQTIGMVSPAGALRVESRVSPRNIGLVRVGQPVRIQVDAYPYTEWGLLDGVVESISGDLFVPESSDSGGYFKVMIRPATTDLFLASGQRGRIGKGHTLTARFVVARRSLLQVLYDDATVWLNPQDNRQPL